MNTLILADLDVVLSPRVRAQVVSCAPIHSGGGDTVQRSKEPDRRTGWGVLHLHGGQALHVNFRGVDGSRLRLKHIDEVDVEVSIVNDHL